MLVKFPLLLADEAERNATRWAASTASDGGESSRGQARSELFRVSPHLAGSHRRSLPLDEKQLAVIDVELFHLARCARSQMRYDDECSRAGETVAAKPILINRVRVSSNLETFTFYPLLLFVHEVVVFIYKIVCIINYVYLYIIYLLFYFIIFPKLRIFIVLFCNSFIIFYHSIYFIYILYFIYIYLFIYSLFS